MKTGLILAAVFVAFGLVGRMDYEDALALEQAQHATQLATQETRSEGEE